MPRRVRPRFPEEWHGPDDPKHWITWDHAEKKLREEAVYWVSTSGRSGRPHAAPVWGIWKSCRFYYETSPTSVKGRNLKANPMAVVPNQDGVDTVIVEGETALVTDSAELRSLSKDYERKYSYRPDWSDERSQVVFKVEPRTTHAWCAPRMHSNLVNFIFEKGRDG